MNRNSQQGLTTIGWIVVIGIFSIIVVTGFKILPLYLEYFNVKAVMESVAADDSIDVRSKRDLWSAISKRLQINQVRSLKKENFSFTRQSDTTTITVDYDVKNPYIAQLYIGVISPIRLRLIGEINTAAAGSSRLQFQR